MIMMMMMVMMTMMMVIIVMEMIPMHAEPASYLHREGRVHVLTRLPNGINLAVGHNCLHIRFSVSSSVCLAAISDSRGVISLSSWWAIWSRKKACSAKNCS